MKKLIGICSMFILFASGYVIADPVFIGGSSDVSPPPFMAYEWNWMTTSVERAFPFTVVSGGPYYVEKLEIPVFNYGQSPPGPSAYFTINPDDAGKPGQSIAFFELDGITTTPQVMVAEAAQSAILDSGSLYWLVGGASEGLVLWNNDLASWGTVAYRVDKGEWVTGETNLSAFAILGSPVPEPATFLLLALGAVMLRKSKK